MDEPGRQARYRPAGIPPPQRAARRRHHGVRPVCSPIRPAWRNAWMALRPHWKKAQAEIAESTTRAGSAARRGIGVGCMWYGIGNTSMSNPGHACKSGWRLDGTLDALQRRARHRAGQQHHHDADRRRRAGPARRAVYPGHRRHRPHPRRAGKTSASRQTFVSGKAAERAGHDLRQQILRLRQRRQRRRAHPRRQCPQGARDGAEVRTLDSRCTRLLPLLGEGMFDPPTTPPIDKDGQGVLLRDLCLCRPDGGGRGRHRARHGAGAGGSWPPTMSARRLTPRSWRVRFEGGIAQQAWASR